MDLVRKHPYEVALLDLRMPGMDGLELYRRMREISAETVAIVVTAYASSDTAKSVLATGAWKILPKPVNIVVKGADKHMVGQFAANIRRVRPPEPYKGKGIRYSDE